MKHRTLNEQLTETSERILQFYEFCLMTLDLPSIHHFALPRIIPSMRFENNLTLPQEGWILPSGTAFWGFKAHPISR
jgi:hypothetical protein